MSDFRTANQMRNELSNYGITDNDDLRVGLRGRLKMVPRKSNDRPVQSRRSQSNFWSFFCGNLKDNEADSEEIYELEGQPSRCLSYLCPFSACSKGFRGTREEGEVRARLRRKVAATRDRQESRQPVHSNYRLLDKLKEWQTDLFSAKLDEAQRRTKQDAAVEAARLSKTEKAEATDLMEKPLTTENLFRLLELFESKKEGRKKAGKPTPEDASTVAKTASPAASLSSSSSSKPSTPTPLLEKQITAARESLVKVQSRPPSPTHQMLGPLKTNAQINKSHPRPEIKDVRTPKPPPKKKSTIDVEERPAPVFSPLPPKLPLTTHARELRPAEEPHGDPLPVPLPTIGKAKGISGPLPSGKATLMPTGSPASSTASSRASKRVGALLSETFGAPDPSKSVLLSKSFHSPTLKPGTSATLEELGLQQFPPLPDMRRGLTAAEKPSFAATSTLSTRPSEASSPPLKPNREEEALAQLSIESTKANASGSGLLSETSTLSQMGKSSPSATSDRIPEPGTFFEGPRDVVVGFKEDEAATSLAEGTRKAGRSSTAPLAVEKGSLTEPKPTTSRAQTVHEMTSLPRKTPPPSMKSRPDNLERRSTLGSFEKAAPPAQLKSQKTDEPGAKLSVLYSTAKAIPSDHQLTETPSITKARSPPVAVAPITKQHPQRAPTAREAADMVAAEKAVVEAIQAQIAEPFAPHQGAKQGPTATEVADSTAAEKATPEAAVAKTVYSFISQPKAALTTKQEPKRPLNAREEADLVAAKAAAAAAAKAGETKPTSIVVPRPAVALGTGQQPKRGPTAREAADLVAAETAVVEAAAVPFPPPRPVSPPPRPLSKRAPTAREAADAVGKERAIIEAAEEAIREGARLVAKANMGIKRDISSGSSASSSGSKGTLSSKKTASSSRSSPKEVLDNLRLVSAYKEKEAQKVARSRSIQLDIAERIIAAVSDETSAEEDSKAASSDDSDDEGRMHDLKPLPSLDSQPSKSALKKPGSSSSSKLKDLLLNRSGSFKTTNDDLVVRDKDGNLIRTEPSPVGSLSAASSAGSRREMSQKKAAVHSLKTPPTHPELKQGIPQEKEQPGAEVASKSAVLPKPTGVPKPALMPKKAGLKVEASEAAKSALNLKAVSKGAVLQLKEPLNKAPATPKESLNKAPTTPIQQLPKAPVIQPKGSVFTKAAVAGPPKKLVSSAAKASSPPKPAMLPRKSSSSHLNMLGLTGSSSPQSSANTSTIISNQAEVSVSEASPKSNGLSSSFSQ